MFLLYLKNFLADGHHMYSKLYKKKSDDPVNTAFARTKRSLDAETGDQEVSVLVADGSNPSDQDLMESSSSDDRIKRSKCSHSNGTLLYCLGINIIVKIKLKDKWIVR